jgi:long-chain acyl-CoA synthetase
LGQGTTWEAAVAEVTGPGGRYAIIETEIDGRRCKIFEHAPPSLRAVFDIGRKRGQDICLVYEDERWSFAQVMTKIDALAAALVDRYGIAPGDRVAIGMRNCPEWIVAFAAVTSIGAIAVCLNAWWTGEELEYGLVDSGAALLIADRERAERVEPARERLGVRVLVVRAGGELPEGVERFEEVFVAGASLPTVDVTPERDATIIYTSGTTGLPKGAVSTHRAVITALMAFGCRAAVNLIMQPAEEEHPWPTSFILVVPLFHVTGLIPVMLGAFASGLKLVMMYKWSPERALELIERERITIFVGVPTMSWDLLESPAFERCDTSSLQSVAGGGAPAPPELVRRVEQGFRRGRPGIGYGMTETNAYGPQNAGDDYLRKPRSAGRVLPIMDLRVTDEAGREVPRGQVGEIWFKGANLIRGYWDDPEATEEAIVDGWLRSGDIGRIDDEGFIYVEDRAKDMVLRAGENVYCIEVEAALYQHPAVYEAAVFGVPHERLGEEVAAAIYPKPGGQLDIDELRAFLRQHIAPFKIPTSVIIRTQQLPRSATGKILKRVLRDELVDGRAPSSWQSKAPSLS